MLKELRPALVLLVLMSAMLGLAYPLAITGIAEIVFPRQAAGSLIERDGKVVGSELIGQPFTGDKYFHGRLSATTDTDPNDPARTIPAPYKADASNASNLGPTSKQLIDRVKDDVSKLRAEKEAPVPVDLVTTSASGLDPHITPAAAAFQAERVAKARGLSVEQLRSLISASTEDRVLGIFGERRVNVLKLNLALDALKGPSQ